MATHARRTWGDGDRGVPARALQALEALLDGLVRGDARGRHSAARLTQAIEAAPAPAPPTALWTVAPAYDAGTGDT